MGTMKVLNYEILKPCYQGKDSFIYRARATNSEQSVILKMPPEHAADKEASPRYHHDFRINQRLDSPHIVRYWALESYHHNPILIEEDFGAVSLADALPKDGLAPLDFFKVALPLIEAIQAIHHQKIVYASLHPRHILIHSQTSLLKLTDFSQSLEIQEAKGHKIQNNIWLKDALYIAPEQTGRTSHPLDYRTDLYSLGAIYYWLLCGRPPFCSEDLMELIHAHLASLPPPPNQTKNSIPQTLSEIVMKLLQKSPGDRYQSLSGLRNDLEHCFQELQRSGTLTPFPLGQHDVSETFQLPKTCYGRENEIAVLLRTLNKAYEGRPQIVFVKGPAGIGKSSLIYQAMDRWAEPKGYCISGKFDQLNQNTAYHGWIECFQSLVKIILSESEESIQAWKQKLLLALGENAQLLLDVVGDLELIVGSQPAVFPLGLKESQNLLNLLFQRLIHVFASSERPLVIFLDDLQWSDEASLSVLQSLVSASETRYLVLIGAYRDDEDSVSSPFNRLLEKLQQAPCKIHVLQLLPIDQPDIQQLIEEALFCSQEDSIPLAELVLEKTAGNPFFVGEFLKSLYQNNLLRYSPQRGWHGEMETIHALEITDNVIAMLVERMANLPRITQNLLVRLASLGTTVSCEMVSHLFKGTSEMSNAQLNPLIEAEILLKTKNQYKFAHDKIQEAAYSLLSESQKQAIHYEIGTSLLDYSDARQLRDDFIFEIVSQLNLGRMLAQSQEERVTIAELNEQAGQKAKASAAFVQAQRFFETGLTCLGKDAWSNHYSLSFSLTLGKTECEYANGEFENAEKSLTILLSHAKTRQEQTEVYCLKIQLQTHQQKRGLAIQVLREALALFGIDFPNSKPEMELKLREERESIEKFFQEHPGQPLLQLPEMKTSDTLCVMQLLNKAFVALYYYDPQFSVYAFAKMVNLSLQQGNSPVTPTAYIGYGVFCYGTDQHHRGREIVQQALILREQIPDKTGWVMGQFLRVSLNHHLIAPLSICAQKYFEMHQFSLKQGNLMYAGITMIHYLFQILMKGNPLKEVYAEHLKYKQFFDELNDSHLLYIFNVRLQLIRALMGQTKSLERLSDADYDETKIRDEITLRGHRNALFRWGLYKEILFYHAGDYHSAFQMAQMAETHVYSQYGIYNSTEHCFYHALILLARSQLEPVDSRDDFLKLMIHNRKQLQTGAKYCPANYQHKSLLVEAEWAWVHGDFETAPTLYNQAIDQAHQAGFLHIEALAFERAAQFYQSQNNLSVSRLYLREACRYYAKWGARAKVDLLRKRHQDGFQLSPAVWKENFPEPSQESQLDVATVTKASQAISEEIVLERLLKRLMTIVLAHAGAQRGGFLLEEEGGFNLQIQGYLEHQEVCITSPRDSSDLQFIPESVLRYVERTQETLLLRDIQDDIRFANDAAVKAHRPKSILCLPILLQQKLIALLYLENNLITGAFTPGHLQLLQLLSAQAAISLENARLYEKQQQHLEQMKELDQLKDEFLANTSHELRTPLAGIIGLSQSLLDGVGGTPSVEQTRHLNMITQSGQRLAHLIDDIQDLSRLKNRDLQLHLQPVALRAIVELVLHLSHPLIDKKNLLLLNSIPPKIPAVMADENRLQQILFNLVGNAIKFTEQGTIEITAVKQETHVQIHVTDTGMGISPDKIDRIFNAFEQADGSISRSYGGTGLGLYLTKQLVELHQGELEVQSSLGQGSCFTFSLPLYFGSLKGTPNYSEANSFMVPVISPKFSHSAKNQDTATATATKAQILIVDDDPVNLQVLFNILTQQRYAVSTAINGREALELLALEPTIALVLLDVMMPGVNGYDVCREMRRSFEATDLPIILLTARTQPEDLVAGLKAGANDYLTKPVLKEELLARIENHLELKQSVRRLKENERLREVIFQKEKAAEDALAERRHLIRLLDQAGAAQSLGAEEEFLLREVQRLPSTLDKVPEFGQKKIFNEELRQTLVTLMFLSLRYWNQTTQKSKLDLAEESQIWNIYFDANGSPRTRTFDRYLKISTLPKKPRWRDVLQTAYYVLHSCPDTAPELKTLLEAKATHLEQLLR